MRFTLQKEDCSLENIGAILTTRLFLRSAELFRQRELLSLGFLTMRITPLYDGPIMQFDGEPTDQYRPLFRQRRRLERLASGLSRDQWKSASRCQDWSVQDVVTHLTGVNEFWMFSIANGLDERPTRVLSGFDPARTPDDMVSSLRSKTSEEILDQFIATNTSLLNSLSQLSEKQWSMLAEAPPGHIPIRLVASHALWDSWVHERDIALPLGLSVPSESDEISSSLRYVCALSAAFGQGQKLTAPGFYELFAQDPEVSFQVEINQTITVHNCPSSLASTTMQGSAVEILEAFSFRTAMPEGTPIEWLTLMAGLAQVFDAST